VLKIEAFPSPLPSQHKLQQSTKQLPNTTNVPILMLPPLPKALHRNKATSQLKFNPGNNNQNHSNPDRTDRNNHHKATNNSIHIWAVRRQEERCHRNLG
jgi:hypothetical protein